MGYAPRRLELTVGSHRVRLVPPEGDPVERTIELTPRHTRLSPARWIVEP